MQRCSRHSDHTLQLSESTTQPEETDIHEIKPASHCLNLKPNLSFMEQTETTERKRGVESDTLVRDGDEVG